MNTEDKEFENGRSNARNFGGVVYVGGVVAATMLFVTFVLTAFPGNAYLSRVIMTVAGLMVGGSMLAFPVALHSWTVERRHRAIATVLYYIEMLFIAVNTIVSFVTLLAKMANYTAPEWAVLYEPFSVVSIIYVIFAWGTIFLTDPVSRTKQQQREYQTKRDTLISEKKLKYLDSIEGLEDIAEAARREIEKHQMVDENKSFFPTPVRFNSNTDTPINLANWECLACGNYNLGIRSTCVKCGTSRKNESPNLLPKIENPNQPQR